MFNIDKSTAEKLIQRCIKRLKDLHPEVDILLRSAVAETYGDLGTLALGVAGLYEYIDDCRDAIRIVSEENVRLHGGVGPDGSRPVWVSLELLEGMSDWSEPMRIRAVKIGDDWNFEIQRIDPHNVPPVV